MGPAASRRPCFCSNNAAYRACALEYVRRRPPRHASSIVEPCSEDPQPLCNETIIGIGACKAKRHDGGSSTAGGGYVYYSRTDGGCAGVLPCRAHACPVCLDGRGFN